MSMHLPGRHRFLELIEKHKLIQLEEALRIEPLSTHSWGWRYAEAPVWKGVEAQRLWTQEPALLLDILCTQLSDMANRTVLLCVANAAILVARLTPLL
jgi:hypothetical protein